MHSDFTAAYCSPERARAEVLHQPLEVTRALDVWALGLIIYEIFAGEPLMKRCYLPPSGYPPPPRRRCLSVRRTGVSM